MEQLGARRLDEPQTEVGEGALTIEVHDKADHLPVRHLNECGGLARLAEVGNLKATRPAAAGVTDATAAREVLGRTQAEGMPRLVKVLGDHVYGYEGLPGWTKATMGWRLEISGKKEGERGFKVIKWRWVVERTFAWLGRYRRNSRDYEKLPQTSESMLKISSIQLMLRRMKPKKNAFVFHYPKPTEIAAK